MDTEQGVDHSEDLEQQDLSPDDFQRLTALMDDKGSLPPHGEADDAVEEEAAPEKTAQESTEPEAPESEKATPELEEVEYEGRKYTIPPELKGALLRQADYTRKTQEVASERAAAQQERQASQALMQQAAMFSDHFAAIKHIDGQLQQLQNVDWAQLQAVDPIKNLELRTAYGELLRHREGTLSQLNAARQMAQQAELQTYARALEEGGKVLAQEIPNWGPETQQALVQTAVDAGYRKEELAQLTDPRAVKVLYELKTLREKVKEYESKRDVAQKRVQQAPPKPVRASSSRDQTDSPAAAKEIARLRRTGSDADAMAALMKVL